MPAGSKPKHKVRTGIINGEDSHTQEDTKHQDKASQVSLQVDSHTQEDSLQVDNRTQGDFLLEANSIQGDSQDIRVFLHQDSNSQVVLYQGSLLIQKQQVSQVPLHRLLFHQLLLAH